MANISGWMIYPVDDVTEFYSSSILRDSMYTSIVSD